MSGSARLSCFTARTTPPSAERIASSLRRAAKRVSWKLATLAQAISSTASTVACRIRWSGTAVPAFSMPTFGYES
ncbi:MAG TPA: hypothetical protein VIN61_12445 [Gammaproteobacteria bacterium]